MILASPVLNKELNTVENQSQTFVGYPLLPIFLNKNLTVENSVFA